MPDLAIPVPQPELRRLPEPEPSLGREAFLKERELALRLSPEKAANYAKYIASDRRNSKVDYLPTVLDVENISRCNFKCVMCTVAEFPKGKRGRDMTVEEFKRLIDEQVGLVEIKLHGLGEPLLQGDAYYEMIRYARARHIWVRTVTNGSALHINDNIRKLVDSGINEIQVSIDGADKRSFELIRRGSHFERVVENALRLNTYCSEKGVTLTKMWTVVQKENAHQLSDLVELAAKLRFPSQVFSLQMHGWGNDQLGASNNARSMDGHLNHRELLALSDRGKELGVKVAFWNITAKYSSETPGKLCPWPFERSYVSSEGRTVPCCMIGNPDNFELAKGMSLREAWQGDEYEAFRLAHLTGNIPAICKACYESR
ncbi:radical SAM/SPASM domain-containing protein [Nibricoccus sp. IMCC34717]|uniref:radical SAM protein n=1 Tax=Nibricoccus sp. IMCC34717 TaxID=3034021 RepID=UPI00384D200F